MIVVHCCEARERQFTNPIDFEAKEIDFGKQRSTAMKQNKYFEMSRPVNRKDEMRLQTLKTRLLETARKVVKETNDEKGMPKISCYTEEERLGLKSLVKRRRDGRTRLVGQPGAAHQRRPGSINGRS